jgi:adenylate cyclase
LERRLAAILAADVVGYSRLMGADEAGTLARLKALRRELVQPKIAERGRRIVKLMGDGLLAEFPSVVEAVQAAVEIQEATAEREPDLPQNRRAPSSASATRRGGTTGSKACGGRGFPNSRARHASL